MFDVNSIEYNRNWFLRDRDMFVVKDDFVWIINNDWCIFWFLIIFGGWKFNF